MCFHNLLWYCTSEIRLDNTRTYSIDSDPLLPVFDRCDFCKPRNGMFRGNILERSGEKWNADHTADRSFKPMRPAVDEMLTIEPRGPGNFGLRKSNDWSRGSYLLDSSGDCFIICCSWALTNNHVPRTLIRRVLSNSSVLASAVHANFVGYPAQLTA